MKKLVYVSIAVILIIAMGVFLFLPSPKQVQHPVSRSNSTNYTQENISLQNQPQRILSTPCNHLEDTELKMFCIALYTQNTSDCNGLQNNNQMLCSAMIKHDLASCGTIQDISNRIFCTAMVKQNSTICEGLIQSNLKDSCRFELSMVRQDSRICDEISNTEIKNTCLSITTQDSRYCANLSATRKDACYLTFAKNTKDTAYCAQVQSSQNRDACYLAITNKSDS